MRSALLCEAYEVGWDFVIAPEQQWQQQQSQPHQNHAASHTGEGPSCIVFFSYSGFMIDFNDACDCSGGKVKYIGFVQHINSISR